MKKEEFKSFIKSHPELFDSVNSGKTTWQHLYELYDLYGEEAEGFKVYFNKSEKVNISNTINVNGFKNALETLKELDMETVKSNLSSIQKAVSFLEDFTAPEESASAVKNIVNPKPLEHFFGD